MSIINSGFLKKTSDWSNPNNKVKITYQRNGDSPLTQRLSLEHLSGDGVVIKTDVLIDNLPGFNAKYDPILSDSIFTAVVTVYGDYRIKVENTSATLFYAWVDIESETAGIKNLFSAKIIESGTSETTEIVPHILKAPELKLLGDWARGITSNYINTDYTTLVFWQGNPDRRKSIEIDYFDATGRFIETIKLLTNATGGEHKLYANLSGYYKVRVINNSEVLITITLTATEKGVTLFSHKEVPIGGFIETPILFYSKEDEQIEQSNKVLIKRPDKLLIFKKTNVNLFLKSDGEPITKAKHDGSTWLIANAGNMAVNNVYKVEDVDDQGTITEGVLWNDDWGVPKNIIVFPDDSFVVFTDKGAAPIKCHIYKFSGIQDDMPALVYESAHESFWAGGSFGLSHHTNGYASEILAGEYGQSTNSKDLLYCKDYGETWSVIKSTGDSVDPENYNVHFHDVEIDPYNGILWAAQGDGVNNAKISYSRTNGVAPSSWNSDIIWRDIEVNPILGVGKQPTLIMAFPDYVYFGNDSDISGLARLKQPKTLTEWDTLSRGGLNLIRMYYVTRHRGVWAEGCYAQHPMKFAINEGIYSESSHGSLYPLRIHMTGDGGISWHTVGIQNFAGGQPSAQTIGRGPICIDDRYIYFIEGASGRLIIAEKPKFE